MTIVELLLLMVAACYDKSAVAASRSYTFHVKGDTVRVSGAYLTTLLQANAKDMRLHCATNYLNRCRNCYLSGQQYHFENELCSISRKDVTHMSPEGSHPTNRKKSSPQPTGENQNVAALSVTSPGTVSANPRSANQVIVNGSSEQQNPEGTSQGIVNGSSEQESKEKVIYSTLSLTAIKMFTDQHGFNDASNATLLPTTLPAAAFLSANPGGTNHSIVHGSSEPQGEEKLTASTLSLTGIRMSTEQHVYNDASKLTAFPTTLPATATLNPGGTNQSIVRGNSEQQGNETITSSNLSLTSINMLTEQLFNNDASKITAFPRTLPAAATVSANPGGKNSSIVNGSSEQQHEENVTYSTILLTAIKTSNEQHGYSNASKLTSSPTALPAAATVSANPGSSNQSIVHGSSEKKGKENMTYSTLSLTAIKITTKKNGYNNPSNLTGLLTNLPVVATQSASHEGTNQSIVHGSSEQQPKENITYSTLSLTAIRMSTEQHDYNEASKLTALPTTLTAAASSAANPEGTYQSIVHGSSEQRGMENITISTLSLPAIKITTEEHGYNDASKLTPLTTTLPSAARTVNRLNSPMLLSHISAGYYGLWAISTNGTILYRKPSYDDLNAINSSWKAISVTTLTSPIAVHSGAHCAYATYFKSIDTYMNVWIDTSLEDRFNVTFIDTKRFDNVQARRFANQDSTSYYSLSGQGNLAVEQVYMWNNLGFASIADVIQCSSDVWKDIAFGRSGLWALANNGSLFYLNGSRGAEATCLGTWEAMKGNYSYVATAQDMLIVISANGTAYSRLEISRDMPLGSCWKKLDLDFNITEVAISPSGVVWFLSSSGVAYFAK